MILVLQASSPVVPTLGSDSSADWSVSMATPTNLRHAVKRETPIVTTTDEEVSGKSIAESFGSKLSLFNGK